MNFNRGRWTLLGAIGGALLLAACGGSKNLGGDKRSSGAGTSGSASGPSSGGVSGAAGGFVASDGGGGGSGGTTGGITGESGESGDAGQPGTAGEPGTVANPYEFFVLPGLAPLPLDTEKLYQNMFLRSYSADLELLTGDASWRRYGPDSVLESGEVPFVWTRAGGVQAVPEAVLGSLRVAADGSAVFGIRSRVPGAISLLRWTPSDGVEEFEIEDASELVPPGVDPAFMRDLIGSVSANGMAVAVAGLSGDTHRLWRLGHDQNRALKVNATPFHFSRDGSMLFLRVDESFGKRHIYRASVASEPFTLEELKPAAGYTDCTINPNGHAQPTSADGSLVIGTCGWSTSQPRMFRWEAGDETMTIVAEGPPFPMVMSPDGSNILGTTHDGGYSADSKLVWWNPEASLVVPTRGRPVGLRPDGVSAWVVLEETSATVGPRLWSRSEGLLPLPDVANERERSRVLVALSADGALGLGRVDISGPDELYAATHPLLWDGLLGMRDVAEELTAAGLDLSGPKTQKRDSGLEAVALHVDGDAIVILGNDATIDGYQTWLARIPAR
ncbi:MAG TPA: hypothetical protein VEX18_13365 [Polyangiaceae bacterium]|nr:hypothetical protein [Polyangiaceae bacterium]